MKQSMPPLKKHVWAFADGNKWDQRKVKNDTKWSSNNSTGKRKQSEKFQYKVECKTKSITDKNKANLWLATPPHDQFFVFQLHYPSSSQRERNKRRKQKSTREIMWFSHINLCPPGKWCTTCTLKRDLTTNMCSLKPCSQLVSHQHTQLDFSKTYTFLVQERFIWQNRSNWSFLISQLIQIA